MNGKILSVVVASTIAVGTAVPATAADFTFDFGLGTTGILRGLPENGTGQPTEVEIVSSVFESGVGIFTQDPGTPSFFEVSDGELVSAFFSGSLGASANSDNVFNLFIDFSDDNPVNFGSLLIVGGSPGSIDGGVITFEKSQDNPQATVPEPASLIGILTIGAATVFGRCKRHSTT